MASGVPSRPRMFAHSPVRHAIFATRICQGDPEAVWLVVAFQVARPMHSGIFNDVR